MVQFAIQINQRLIKQMPSIHREYCDADEPSKTYQSHELFLYKNPVRIESPQLVATINFITFYYRNNILQILLSDIILFS